MTIGDTWPQTGEMRSLWKGTKEFWTSDMLQGDTWQPNRHHIFTLFRNHLTRNAVAMFPPLVNPVAPTEHECRDHLLPAVSHTEDAEEKGRSVVLVVPELSNAYSTHHGDTGTSKSIQRKLVSEEEERHSSQKVEGRTELDLVQDEVDEAKRLLEQAHLEEQAAQIKVTEAAFREGEAMEEMSQIKKLLKAKVEPADH